MGAPAEGVSRQLLAAAGASGDQAPRSARRNFNSHNAPEALTLGQDLAADDATLAQLFTTRGIWLAHAGRRGPEAAAYFREAARLATQAGEGGVVGG